MTDRDRLAADLHDDEHPAMGPLHCPYCFCGDKADRLIALGWTRLDGDRLARALASIEGDFVGKGSMWTVRAAAIAKAYREDTEHE